MPSTSAFASAPISGAMAHEIDHFSDQIQAIRYQREEIGRYRAHLSARLGREVSLDEAARRWISTFASEWREQFEAGLHAARQPIAFATTSESNDITKEYDTDRREAIAILHGT